MHCETLQVKKINSFWNAKIVNLLTRWVPHDGYTRHQNDHVSGRMTDLSVTGEWQVADVGGSTRPLWNVLGEAIEGRFSFEARNYLLLSTVMSVSKSFFPRFWKIWRQMFKLCSSGAFGFDDVLGLFLKTPLCHRVIIFFCELWLRPQVFLENFLSFFQSRAGFTYLRAMAIPSLSKPLWFLLLGGPAFVPGRISLLMSLQLSYLMYKPVAVGFRKWSFKPIHFSHHKTIQKRQLALFFEFTDSIMNENNGCMLLNNPINFQRLSSSFACI